MNNKIENNFGIVAEQFKNNKVTIKNSKQESIEKQAATDEYSCFVSYTAINRELAKFVKQVLLNFFSNVNNCCVACDGNSITPGKKWADEILQTLQRSSSLILLLCPESIEKRWLNMEFGIAWANDLQIIPLCFGGLTKEDLPEPIKSYQAIELSEPFDTDAKLKLVKQLAAAFKEPVPQSKLVLPFCANANVKLYEA